MDDLAAKMGVSSLDIYLRNLAHITQKDKAKLYTDELQLAAKLIEAADSVEKAGRRK